MRKIGLISLALAAALLPSTMFADRLNGVFETEDSTNGQDNEMCTVVEPAVVGVAPTFGVAGEVTALNGTCTVRIRYATLTPHKASATGIKSGKNTGSANVSQSIDTAVQFVIEGVGCDTAPYVGSALPEKCKASGSIKGTAGDPDSVDSSKGSVSCEVGPDGVDLSPPPTPEQVSTITAAFGTRTDVKFEAPKKGKLTIKHTGIPAETSTECFAFAGSVVTTTTTTLGPTTTTTTSPTTTTTTTTAPPV